MIEMEYENERTLVLVKELIDCIQLGERLGYATFLFDPLGFLRREFTKRRLEEHDLRILKILMYRYEGIIHQVLDRAKSNTDLPALLISRIWFETRGKCLTLRDYRGFSGLVWKTCISVTQSPASSLKPKFMLRQFVDEMLSSDERGILMSRAYSSDAWETPFSREMLPKLSAAYALLHLQLLNHEDDLEILTDGAITPAMIRDFKPPFPQYKQWLFDS